MSSQRKWTSSSTRKSPPSRLSEFKLTRSRSGSNWRPQPFKVQFEVRSEEIRRTIEREGRQALEDLKKFERETKYRFSTFGK
jgi:hypothetical protein